VNLKSNDLSIEVGLNWSPLFWCQRAPKRGQATALSKGASWTRLSRLISIGGILLHSSRKRGCKTGSQWTKNRELRSFLPEVCSSESSLPRCVSTDDPSHGSCDDLGLGEDIPYGICARMSAHRLLPIDWPDGPQTVKANQRGNKTNKYQKSNRKYSRTRPRYAIAKSPSLHVRKLRIILVHLRNDDLEPLIDPLAVGFVGHSAAGLDSYDKVV